MVDKRSLSARRKHVYAKCIEFGIFAPDAERDLIAEELRAEEDVLVVVRGRVPADLDSSGDRGEGTAAATNQRVIFVRHGPLDEAWTCFLPLDEVEASSVSVAGRPSIRFKRPGQSSIYITFAAPEFSVPRFVDAVNSAALGSSPKEKPDQQSGERPSGEATRKPTASQDPSIATGRSTSAQIRARLAADIGNPYIAQKSTTPSGSTNRRPKPALTSNNKSESGSGRCTGCMTWAVLALAGVMIIGFITNVCFADDNGDDRLYFRPPTPTSINDPSITPTPHLLTPARQEAYREAQRRGLDVIAAANGISENRLAHFMIREEVEVKHDLKQLADNPNRVAIVRARCYDRQVNFHRPQVLQSGLSAYCGDLVDQLK